MATREFKPGFRLSAVDLLVLTVGGIAIVAFGSSQWVIALIVGFVVSHFFLFCNVFRVSRPPELLWSLVFVLLAGSTVLWDIPGWTVSILGSLAVTVMVVVLEMRKVSYHGIGWWRINPNLRDWWERHGD